MQVYEAYRRCLLLPVICCAIWATVNDIAAAQQIHAYYASTIWPGDGPAIHDAVLVVQGSKIVAIGPRSEVKIPERAIEHDLSGQTLIPGLVIAQTSLVESARDSDYALSPEVRSIDGFDPFADYDRLMAAGITTIQLSPGAGRLIPGQGAVVKLGGEDPRQQVLVESESLRIILKQDALSPPTIYEPPVGAVSVERPLEPTRPQLATSLAQAIVGLDALFSEAKDGEAADVGLAALAQLMQAKRTVRFSVDNAAEVKAALDLAVKFNLSWLMVDPTDTSELSAVDWNAAASVGVILNPEMRAGRITNPNIPIAGRKQPDPVWVRAKTLVDAGAGKKLAVYSSTDADLDDLLFSAGIFGRGGLSTEQILSMLTANPAQMLGVNERVGRLRAGADADFCVLSAPPFTTGSRVVATYLNGERKFSAKVNQTSLVITAAKVYTQHGVTDGGVSVMAGKITGVGSDLSIPRNAAVKHFDGAYIIPGLIDCKTAIGIGGSLAEKLALNTKLGELLAREDDQIALARQGGVTTALLSSTQLPSPVIAFKLSDSPRPLKDPVALRFEISGNLTEAEESMRRTLRSGKAYSDAWDKYDTEFAVYVKALKEYETAKAKYDAAIKAAEAKQQAEKKAAESKAAAEKAGAKPAEADAKKEEPKPAEAKPDAAKPAEAKPAEATPGSDSKPSSDAKPETKSEELKEPTKPTEPKKPPVSEAMEPYRNLFQKKIVALVELTDVRAVEVAIKLFREEFDIRTAIVADAAAAEKADLLAKHHVLVIVGPTLTGDDKGDKVNFPAELSVAGVPFAFQSNSGTGVSMLPDAVAYAVFQGLGRSAAMKGLSYGPAEFLKLDSVGSIEIGRDADLVVLSGPPLEISSEVLAVMIDGTWVFEKESE
jgi:imidazolonepropionase-like amidohydrolase